MPYDALCELNDEIAILRSTAQTLGWDQETNLPRKALAYRAKQLSYLSAKIHSLVTSSEYANLLINSEETVHEDNFAEMANVREWRHHYNRATQLPEELIIRSSEATSHAKVAWKEAREKADYSLFAPHLARQLDIAREKAELWGYTDEPYTALLSGYERGTTTTEIAKIFNTCREDLIEIAALATAKAVENPSRELTGKFPEEKQKILNAEVAESIGFDFEAGRIDTTTHPFCSGIAPEDTRLTTRYDETNFISSLFGVMHEAGHGMYEQGLNKKEYGRPAGTAISLGIHESQSLLWENHIGRSRAFWTKWLPRVQELFPQMQDWSIYDILAHINAAKYSYIRVDADEATYDLHILLRFDLERKMINGDIKVKDIPSAWNEAFDKLLGITPPDDSLGCLQDIHWSMGGLGYFATYSLGNFNASQLFNFAKHDKTVADACDNADYAPLLKWMQSHIHEHGSIYLPQDLMRNATGSSTNPHYHLEHLKRRFL